MAARAERPPLSVVVSRGRVSSWLTTVDHKRIGILYIVTTLVFLLAGGVLALLMRAQLATPNEDFITKNDYNQLFTMHGTTMIFLVVVPFWAGLANYLVPLMIGARDMAFPRLNAFGYWVFLAAGLFLYSGLVLSRRIDQARTAAGGAPSALPEDDPRRIEFGRLHAVSTALLGIGVVGGLILCYWETRE